MAREKGMFQVAASYEPLKAAPFDARMKAECKADLVKPETWRLANGEIWLFDGLIVAVATDVNPLNNGLYMLLSAANYTQESSWMKFANQEDVKALEEQIKNIEIPDDFNEDVEVETEADLPEVGEENVTYFVKENLSIQRWDSDDQAYDIYGGQGSSDIQINLIHGGNSNG